MLDRFVGLAREGAFERSSSILTCNATQCPSRVAANQGLILIEQETLKGRHGIGVASIPQGNGDIAQVTATLRAFQRAAAELAVEGLRAEGGLLDEVGMRYARSRLTCWLAVRV